MIITGKIQDNLTVNPIHTNGILNQFIGLAERKRPVEAVGSSWELYL